MWQLSPLEHGPGAGARSRRGDTPERAPRSSADVRRPARLDSPTPFTLGRAHDPAEREADDVARRVVAGLSVASRPARSGFCTTRIRRRPGPDAGAGAGASTVDDAVSTRLQRAIGRGGRVPDRVRAEMGTAFGADFGPVRLHTDREAGWLARSLDAEAFTTGNDVFVRGGSAALQGRRGSYLLAHELTHVVQQGGELGTVRRLKTGDEFEKGSALWFGRKSDSDATFKQLADGLRKYEASKSLSDLAEVSDVARLWMVDNYWSTRYGNARELVEQIADELRRQAIAQLGSAGLSPAHRERAGDILKNPDSIQQGAFGICGLVSILKPMAMYVPDKFLTLATQAFSDTGFDTTDIMDRYNRHAYDVHKKIHADFDYLLSHWLLKRGAAVRTPGSDLSHTVAARGTGGTEERQKTKPAGEVFTDQTDFSDTFNINDWEDLGHYATTAGGLTYILNTVLNAPKSRKIKVVDIVKDYQLARSIVGRKGKVVAAVKDTDVYQAGGAVVTDPPEDKHGANTGPSGSGSSTAAVATTGPKYDHFVIIDDLTVTGSNVQLQIWTWADHFTAKVATNVAHLYFPQFVAATFS